MQLNLGDAVTDEEDHPTRTTKDQLDVEMRIRSRFRPPVGFDPAAALEYVRSVVNGSSKKAPHSETFSPWKPLQFLVPIRALGADQDPDFEGALEAMTFYYAARRDSGAFSGFPTDNLHMVTVYAALTGVAAIGTPAAYELVDRSQLLRSLQALKLSNGAFRTTRDMEHDVRATFAALVVADLTNILTAELSAGVREYVLSCLNYDGGVSPRPGLESHGGYLHCAVGAMSILGRLDDLPLAAMARWIAMRQCECGGGFNGRPNKLVDSCYSWWIGSPARIISEHLKIPPFWNEKALSEFVANCCQDVRGGLGERPGSQSDAFHTLYALAGVGIAGGRDLGPESGVTLPEFDPLIPCPTVLADQMRMYFRSKGEITTA
jgi:protein farnesyltransferase subunit beta